MTLLCLLQLLLQILRIGTARFRRHTIRCERLVAPLSFYIASSRHSNERRWMCELVSGMFLFHFYTSPFTKRRPSASSHIHTRRLSLSFFSLSWSASSAPTASQPPSAMLEICPQPKSWRPTGELYIYIYSSPYFTSLRSMRRRGGGGGRGRSWWFVNQKSQIINNFTRLSKHLGLAVVGSNVAV